MMYSTARPPASGRIVVRTLRFVVPALPALFLLLGCATADEWATWREHPAHFASADHLVFSMRNGARNEARVTRRDVALARDQDWWGKAVTVDQGMILER
jgi:hypothetical protein